MKEFLKLPIRFEHFFAGQKLAVCNLKDSIYRNLHLLITTVPGENKTDDQYGATFWDEDYDIHLSNDVRKELIVKSLSKQISLFEKRLNNVSVDVNLKLADMNANGTIVQRKKIEITIKGNIARSTEPFIFQTGFYIGPLTFD